MTADIDIRATATSRAEELAKRMKPYLKLISLAAYNGNKVAKRLVDLCEMHRYSCSDFEVDSTERIEAVFNEWMESRS